jgi:hypothetical protein
MKKYLCVGVSVTIYARNNIWTDVKIKHPTQVEPQMKKTLTPRFAALIASRPVLEGSTRYGVA